MSTSATLNILPNPRGGVLVEASHGENCSDTVHSTLTYAFGILTEGPESALPMITTEALLEHLATRFKGLKVIGVEAISNKPETVSWSYGCLRTQERKRAVGDSGLNPVSGFTIIK